MKINSEIKKSFDFHNLAMVSKETDVKLDQVTLDTKLTRNIDLKIPLISAAHESVTDSTMAIEMARFGGVGILHSNITMMKLVEEITKVKQADAGDAYPYATKDEKGKLVVAALLRQGADSFEHAAVLADAGLDVLFLEGNHLNTREVAETVKALRRQKPDLQIIAGNVFSAADVRMFIESGADGVKLGGRKQILEKLGVDVLSFQAMIDIISEASVSLSPVIFDDDVNNSPLLAKIIGAGFSAVTLKEVLTSGNVKSVIDNLTTSLKATMAYTGNNSIKTFVDNVEFSCIS